MLSHTTLSGLSNEIAIESTEVYYSRNSSAVSLAQISTIENGFDEPQEAPRIAPDKSAPSTFVNTASKSQPSTFNTGSSNKDPSVTTSEQPQKQQLVNFTVTNTADSGAGSLRQAILDANANGGADTINFSIGAGGAQTITLASNLPVIADTVTLDATTQLGYVGTPLIEVNANGNFVGFNLGAGSDGSEIRGLVINNASLHGIQISGTSGGHTIAGNYIGTSASGNADAGNGNYGVFLSDSSGNNVIGGLNVADRNVISGNDVRGVYLSSGDSNSVFGNYIGIGADGTTALGNGNSGVTISSSNNTIGSTTPNAPNTIAHHTDDGVYVLSGTGNEISANYIHSNADLGIDLSGAAVTLNDGLDVDGGSNNQQNFPIIHSVNTDGVSVISLSGTFNSNANVDYRIEFFSNASADSSEHGEGEVYIGAVNVTTDVAGNANFDSTLTAAVAVGRFISATATATSNGAGTLGDTSEFAKSVVARDYSTAVVTTASDIQDGVVTSLTDLINNKGSDGRISLREAILASNTTTNSGGPDKIFFEIPESLVSGSHLISPGSDLPAIDDAVIIDGTTDSNFVSTPIIEITGTSAGSSVDGLRLESGSDGSTVRGLVINQFDGDGLLIESDSNLIAGNYVGTDVTGTIDQGNVNDGIKIQLGGSNNTIGGTSSADRNLVSGNNDDGIEITGSATSNIVYGNYIGTTVSGTDPLGNSKDGIEIDTNSVSSVIGGITAGQGNIIAYNLDNGVHVNNAAGDGHTIRGNSIFSNTNLGIDLAGGTEDGFGVTANDPLDADAGVNSLQNFPIALAATRIGGETQITGRYEGAASASITLDFYSDNSADGSDHGEARSYIGSQLINTDTDGFAVFSADLPQPTAVGDVVSASATQSSTGNTSEFSEAVVVAADSLNSGLVAHYRLDEGSGVTTVDSTGLGNDGGLQGSPAWIHGQVGPAALDFTGDFDRVEIDDDAAFDFDGSDFSIGFWFNSSTISGFNARLAGQSSGLDGWLLYADNLDNLNFLVNGDSISTLLTASNVIDDDWHYVTALRNGNTFELYIDGALEDTATAAVGNVNSTDQLRFGASDGANGDYDGQLDDIRIYNRALSQTEIDALSALPATAFWFSTPDDVSSSGVTGADSWTEGSAIQIADPSLAFEPGTTSGTAAVVFNLDAFPGGDDGDISGVHYVSSDITVNGIALQAGDAVFAITADITVTGTSGTYTANKEDIHFFRPDTAGDYSAGSFAELVDSPTAGEINALTLLEEDVALADTTLDAGDFLLALDSPSSGSENDIFYYDVSLDTTSTLVNGDQIGLGTTSNAIDAIDIIERDQLLGDVDLQLGQILVSLNSLDSDVGSNNGTILAQSVAILDVAATTLGSGTAAATSTDFIEGQDFGLNTVSENISAFSVAPTAQELVVDGAPSDLQATETTSGGLSINQDGGNDVYLLADDGGAVLGGLSSATVEIQFSSTAAPGSIPLLSYADSTANNSFLLDLEAAGNLRFHINGASVVSLASTFDYNSLLDGKQHTVSATWEGAAGSWQLFVDGALVDSGTGLVTGQSINGTSGDGAVIFGQEQDSVAGGFDSAQVFAGTLYDVRIFGDVRTAAEIQASYRSDLPFDEDGLLANWTFEQLSTDGVVTETVAGNNLTVEHVSQSGFTASEASLTLRLDENSVDGTVVGAINGIDAEREAQIAALLAADPDLLYSTETGKFYKLVANPADFSTAQANAQSELLNGINGQLITIRSAEEQSIAADLVFLGSTDIWLGGTDATAEGEWLWLTGNSDDDQFWQGDQNGYNPNGAYTNWLAGKPDSGSGNEDAIGLRHEDGKWDDSRESNNNFYVVEWNADEVLDATQALVYTITSQTVSGAFEIDSDTGELRVADGTRLDADTQPIHTVTVRTTDISSNTIDAAFSITLNDLIEANSAPTDLSSGIELNTDGGNDAYLIAQDGGAVFGGLDAFTVEVSFNSTTTNDAATLFSYAAASTAFGNDAKLEIYNTGVNAGQLLLTIDETDIFSSAIDFRMLLDGVQHSIAASWDNTNGAWTIYVDGELVDHGRGIAIGATIGGGGTLLFGQEQDANGGGFQVEEHFSGILYDVRVWDRVRSAADVAHNYQHKLDVTPAAAASVGLRANWQMEFNGSSEVIDIVSEASTQNRLSIANVVGAGFSASAPISDLNIDENSVNGTPLAFIDSVDPNLLNDLLIDGLFLEAPDPGTNTLYTATQSFGGWTVDSGNVHLFGTTLEDSPLGGHSVDLNGSTAGSIGQDLVTVSGRQYQVVFATTGAWVGSSDTKHFRASAAGESQDFAVEYQPDWSQSDVLWQHRTFEFTADATSTRLVFQSLESANEGGVVADIQVYEIPQAVQSVLNSEPSLSYDAATGKFYKVVQSTEVWSTAQSIAIADQLNGVSGQLATVRSAYEQELIRSMIEAVGITDAWLGGSDAAVEGEWRWLSGVTPVDQFADASGDQVNGSFERFGGTEPNGGAGENQLEIRALDGAWNDEGSSTQNAYVIEWDASQVLSNYTYALTSDAGGRFAIDSNTGEITVANGSLLDFETDPSHSVTAEVTDAAGATYSESVTVTVNDVFEGILVVDTPNDIDDGDTSSISNLFDSRGADGFISLREAITAANNTVNGLSADEIHFNIAGAGPHTLSVTSALPEITDALVIDASTEPGYAVGAPAIELDGSGAGAGIDGLTLSGGSDGSTIRGLVINRFTGDGIELNGGSGNHTIVGNFIGTDVAGTAALANTGSGIFVINSNGNQIGGLNAADRNVVSGNIAHGIVLHNGTSINQIQGNFIGVASDGVTALGNSGAGIYLINGAANNTIGGTTASAGNTVSANNRGIHFIFANTDFNTVQGNFIGTDASRTVDLGNALEGILIEDGANNLIGGTAGNDNNYVLFNDGDGIAVSGPTATGNSLLGNVVYANAGLGIDLLGIDGVEANDNSDADSGANDLQNYPILIDASIVGPTSITIDGNINSSSSTDFRIEFYANTAANGSGFGEGERYLGFTTVSTNTSGNATFTAALAASVSNGEFITATASEDLGGGNFGGASEFSAAIDALLPLPLVDLDADDSSAAADPNFFGDFTEGGGPVQAVDSDATITDADSGNLNSVTVTLGNPINGAAEILAANTAGTSIAATYASGTGVLSLTGSDTVANYQQVLRTVTYNNVSAVPDTTARTLTVIANDGDNNGNVAVSVISVTAVNNIPAFITLDANPTYTEGSSAINLDGTSGISDPELNALNGAAGNYGGSTLQLARDTGPNADDQFSFSDGNGITLAGGNLVKNSQVIATFDTISVVGELLVNFTDVNTEIPNSVDVNNILSQITYENSNSNPPATVDIDFLFDDGNTSSQGTGGSGQANSVLTVNISASNDGPVLSNNNLTVIEGNTVTLSAAQLSASDVDSDDSTLIFTVSGVSGGQFELASSPQVLITSFTQAQITAGQVVFVHDGGEAGPAYSVTVSDGSANVGPQAATISFTTVNDAPIIQNIDGDSVTAFNDGSTTNLDANVLAALQDNDSPSDYDGAFLQLTGSSFDVLDQLGIDASGSINLSAGISDGSQVTIGGTSIGSLASTSSSAFRINFNVNATGGHIDALLRSITFTTTSTTLGSRSVDFLFNDNDGTANGGIEASDAATMQIFVAQTGDGLVSGTEDTTYSFITSDFDFTGITGANLTAIEILTLPANGTLNYNGSAAVIGQVVTKTDIDGGLLQFVPDLDDNGSPYASFDFQVNNGKLSISVLAGQPNSFTLNGGALAPTDAILAAGSNFGAGGTYGSAISVVAPSNTIDASYLAQGSVLFNGFVPDGSWTAPELAALDTWVQAGGVLITNSDAVSFDEVSEFYGLVIGGTASPTWHVADQTTEIMNGPFGLVGTNGSAFSAAGSISYFTTASLVAGDQVLATDSVSGEPTMVLRQHGSGWILFTSDEGIFRAGMTGGGAIATANDRLAANVFAWAAEQVPASSSHTMDVNVAAVNDTPVTTNLGAAEAYTEDNPLDLINIVVSDVDNANTTVTLTLSDTAAGALSTATSGAVTSTYNAGSGVWTASGAIADVNTLLAGVTFTPALNYTSNFSIATSVSDGIAPAVTATKNVTGTAVNDAPTATNLSAAESYTEDTPLNLFDTVVTDVDNANTTVTLTLSDTAAGALSTATSGAVTSTYNTGSGIWTAAGAVADVNTLLAGVIFTPALDYYSNFSIATSVSDGIAPPLIGTKNIAATPVNDAPTATNLNAAESYSEDTPLNLIDSVVSDVDDSTTTVTLTLSDAGAGALSTGTEGGVTSTYNAGTGVWTASGAVADVNALLAGLTFTPALNYDQNFSIATSVSDGIAPSVTGTKSVTGTAVNDAPTATNLNSAEGFTEDIPLDLVDIVVTDVDNANTTVTLTLSDAIAGALSTGTSGSVTSTYNSGSGVWTASGAVADVNSLLSNVSYTPSLNYDQNFSIATSVSDGIAPTVTGMKNVTVTAVNDAPTATNLNAAEGFTEDTPVDLIDSVVNDVDNANTAVTLALSDAAAGGLSTGTSGAVTSTYNAGSGVWTASGAVADVNALLASVVFTPAPDYNSNFSIVTSVSDGIAPVLTGTKNIIATAVNDAPMATNPSAVESYTEETPFSLVDIVVSDVDHATTTAILTLSDPMAGSLSVATSGAVTSVFNSSSGVWFASGAIADVNALLAGVVFTPALDYDQNFTIATSVSDGVAPAVTGLKSVIATPVNDAPTATNLSAAETYTEDTSLDVIDLVVTDVDNTNTTVTLTLSDTAAGSLSTDTSGAVTSTYNAGTGVWTAAGAVADVNTLLAAVTFTPTLHFDQSFTIATSVSDGIAPALTGLKSVSAIPINDAPVATNLNTPESYTEDTPLDLNDIVITDVDTGNTTVILTMSDVAAGTLSTATSGSVSSTYNAVTGVWTASGSVTDVNNLLAGVTFTPTLHSSADFTIATAVSDGVAPAVTGVKAVTGLAVNDAPTATNIDANETYTEDVPLDLLDIVVTDVDDANVVVTLTLSDPLAGTLNTDTFGSVASSYDPAAGVWQASGLTADVNSLLANLVFTPTMNISPDVTVSSSISDGTAPDVMGSKILFGTAVNDAPTATNMDAPETFVEDLPLDIADIVVSDIDSSTITVTLTLSNTAAGQLTTSSVGASSSTFDPLTGEWAVTGLIAEVNALLVDVSFVPSADFSESFTIFTSINDGVAPPLLGNKPITNVAVNDPPEATNLSIAQSYTEDTPLTLAPIVVTDVDSPNITVTLMLSNPAAGVLSTSSAGAITSTYNSVSGEWRASGALADVNALLASIVFSPAQNYNDDLTIGIEISDGIASVTGNRDLNGLAVNDAPLGSGERFDLIEDGTLEIELATLLANDRDVEDDDLSFVLVDAPRFGQLTATDDGRLVYQPTLGFAGRDFFTYRVSDGDLESALLTVELIVQDDGAQGTIITEPEQETEKEEPKEDSQPATPIVPPVRPVEPGGEGVAGEKEQRLDTTLPRFNVGTLVSQRAVTQLLFDVPAILADDTPIKRALSSLGNNQLDLEAMEELFASDDLWREIAEVDQRLEPDRLFAQAMAGSGVALSTGVIAWILRGGSLLASFLTTIPAWRTIDPLPIMAKKEKDDNDLDENEKKADKFFEQL
ncbi:MAG: LamG-like jellyroll fold domain-containing protein [Pseudomonadota bacterium]